MIKDVSSYEVRIVAYIDILGWSNSINKKIYDICHYENLLNDIAKYAENFSPHMKEKIKKCVGENAIADYIDIEFSYFSDCLALSAPVNSAESIFKILAVINDILLRNNFLIRGGITAGELYHHKGIIFGAALIEAVELEKNATYSRILCSNDLIKRLGENEKKFILQDCKQDWIVNATWGSEFAYDELMKIIEIEVQKPENNTSEKILKKWKYTQKMLPKMYEARNATYF